MTSRHGRNQEEDDQANQRVEPQLATVGDLRLSRRKPGIQRPPLSLSKPTTRPRDLRIPTVNTKSILRKQSSLLGSAQIKNIADLPRGGRRHLREFSASEPLRTLICRGR